MSPFAAFRTPGEGAGCRGSVGVDRPRFTERGMKIAPRPANGRCGSGDEEASAAPGGEL